MSVGFSRVEKLGEEHELDEFDCGRPALNRWLRQFALVNERANAARTYVVCEQSTRRVVGFFSLTMGSVRHDLAPPRVRAGLARHPIPVVLLARLAVDRTVSGRGLGKQLVRDAMLRTAAAAGMVAARALVVSAKDASVASYYERLGFQASLEDPLTPFLLVKDLERSLQELIDLRRRSDRACEGIE